MPTRTVSTDKDAYVDEGAPLQNFGSSTTLWIRWQSALAGGDDRRTLVGFDVSEIFADGDVLDVLAATLLVQPTSADAGHELECYAVDEDAWTEAGVSWNNQPEQGDLQDTEGSGDAPLAWDVTSEVSAAFEDPQQDRIGFLVLMLSGGTAETNSVEHASRESDGQAAVLEVDTREAGRADVASGVEVGFGRIEDLASFVEVKFFSRRWVGHAPRVLTEGDETPVVVDIAHDPDRDRVWAVEEFTGAQVHRFHVDGTHEATFQIVQAGSALSEDVTGVAVWDEGERVLVGAAAPEFGVAGDVLECSVDEASQELVVETRRSAHETQPDFLGIHGDDVWIASFFDGELERRNATNWAQGPRATIGSEDVLGVAGARDRVSLFLWHRSQGRVEERDRDAPGTVARSWTQPARTVESDVRGLAFEDKSFHKRLLVNDAESGEASTVRAYPANEIPATLLIPTPGHADLSAKVHPANLDGHAGLASQVLTGIFENLATTLTPRLAASTEIASSVQPAGLDGDASVFSQVQIGVTLIDEPAQARATGRVAPRVLVSEQDMQDVTGEIGSEITLDPGTSNARDLRRIVQLLDTETQRYPKDRAHPGVLIHRGDAVLFAQRGDEDRFQPGTIVRYQDRDWHIASRLDFEHVGDARMYQEVALKRLAVTHTARAAGRVPAHEHLDSTVEAATP